MDSDIRITKEITEQGKSVKNGWSKKQLEVFDIAWPPYSGWREDLIEKSFPTNKIKEFLQLKNEHFKSNNCPTHNVINRLDKLETELQELKEKVKQLNKI